MSVTMPIRISSGSPMLSRIGLKPSGAGNATARWRRMPRARSFWGLGGLRLRRNARQSTWTSAFACSTVAPGFSLASRVSQLKSDLRALHLAHHHEERQHDVAADSRPGRRSERRRRHADDREDAIADRDALPIADGLRPKRRCQ